MKHRERKTAGESPRRVGLRGLTVPVMAGLLAALCLHATGCVYYNTFYNARKMFRNAERQRAEAVADQQQHAQGGEGEHAIGPPWRPGSDGTPGTCRPRGGIGRSA